MANAIQIKSRDFAIRIVGCYKFLTEKKTNMSCRSNYFDVEQV